MQCLNSGFCPRRLGICSQSHYLCSDEQPKGSKSLVAGWQEAGRSWAALWLGYTVWADLPPPGPRRRMRSCLLSCMFRGCKCIPCPHNIWTWKENEGFARCRDVIMVISRPCWLCVLFGSSLGSGGAWWGNHFATWVSWVTFYGTVIFIQERANLLSVCLGEFSLTGLLHVPKSRNKTVPISHNPLTPFRSPPLPSRGQLPSEPLTA